MSSKESQKKLLFFFWKNYEHNSVTHFFIQNHLFAQLSLSPKLKKINTLQTDLYLLNIRTITLTDLNMQQ